MHQGYDPVGKIRHPGAGAGAAGALTSLSDLAHHFPPPAEIMVSLIAQAHAIWFFVRAIIPCRMLGLIVVLVYIDITG